MGTLDFLSSIVPQWPFASSMKEAPTCPVSHSSDLSKCPVDHLGFKKNSTTLPTDVVTSSFTSHDLKFNAAASLQVPGIGQNVDPKIIDTVDLSGRLSENLLVASPYTDKDHLLDLNTLARPHQLLAKALTIMNAKTGEYAIEPYHEAFNWDEILIALRKLSKREDYVFPRSEFYIIVFRSRLPFDADRRHLGKLDEDAHVEAVESGQLLKYWFGTPHPVTGRNLATCIWRHRDDAKLGGGGPGHVRAMEAVRNIYLEWRVERLKFVVEHDASEWSISKWVD
ncbi:hypothetical protein AOL_s00006g135 [Orbilia oligospora ATCC 24927]|uniref:Uncharacterized protein n=1 Tax=Arthrobotrys oligospora (strain ATCC 24927 / CBS 115.81 / DSM 1491) TaxID=756982 RepID=G1WZT4_ARTOA|nr:hypothetical protein AOL_s00006g135 [Orbilia oligospora ATCC 24927]EGX53269.1 hypothetical protein AOL_s00006g135 [Orbilia oligospora ATCC 24927]